MVYFIVIGMGIFRQAEYSDKKTTELQSALSRDFDEIEERIKNLSSFLDKAGSDISGFNFPEAPTDQNHIQALSLFDADMSHLTGFPPLTDISFGDYNFEAIDPIRLVFDQQFDIGQEHTLEIDLREFYKNLSIQYNMIFATLEKLMKEVNRLMDIIEKNKLDVLEDFMLDVTDRLKMNRFLWDVLRMNHKPLADRNQFIGGLGRYLSELDTTGFPGGFDFKEFDIGRDFNRNRIQQRGLFERTAIELYIETVFSGADDIESIDLSKFQTGAET